MRKWELVCGPQAGQVQVWKADYFNHPFWENPYVCVYARAHVCMCVCVSVYMHKHKCTFACI